MTKTIYISDLDGTLLNSDSEVSSRSARIISDLTHRGALISVATARTPASVVPLMRNAATTPPFIVMTGAALWVREPGCYDSPVFMSPQLLDNVLSVMTMRGINPFVYALDPSDGLLHVYHSMAMNHKENQFYQERRALPLKKFHIGDPLPDRLRDRVILIYTTGPADSVYEAASLLDTPAMPCSVSAYPDIFDPSTALIEVFAPTVSKADAVSRLKKAVGADRLVVFGDNLNDLSMMKVADLAVAVDNARPEVKEQADILIGTNNNDSVALFIADDINA